MANEYKINLDNLHLITICSSIIGVAISYWDIYLFHVLLSFSLLFLVSNVIQQMRNDINLVFEVSHNLIALFITLAWYSMSILWAPNLVYALKYIFYILCGFSIIFLIQHYSRDFFKYLKLINALKYVFIAQIAIALIESFTSFQMPISRYSEISTMFGKTHQPISGNDSLFFLVNSSPPTGFHWDTNELSLSMVLIFPFFLCLDRIFSKSLGIISIISVIIMSASRAVFFGVIISSLFYFIIIKKKITSLFLLIFSSLIIISGMFAMRNSQNPNLNEIANTVNTAYLYLTGDIEIDQSLKWRRELIANGLNALIDTGGVGVGAGGSVAIQEQLGGVDGRFTSMHNFWIEVLVEAGVIFFILFLIWFIKSVIKLWIIARSSKNKEIIYISNSLFLSMIAFIPAAITSSSTIYFFPMWVLFGLVQSLILINAKITAEF